MKMKSICVLNFDFNHPAGRKNKLLKVRALLKRGTTIIIWCISFDDRYVCALYCRPRTEFSGSGYALRFEMCVIIRMK